MEDCCPAATPLSTGLKLSLDEGEILHEPDVYRRLVGRLLYLGITKPDLSYAVQHLSQFMHSPRAPHLKAAMRVVKYLKGTLDHGLHYDKHTDLNIHAYSDSDWSSCVLVADHLVLMLFSLDLIWCLGRPRNNPQ